LQWLAHDSGVNRKTRRENGIGFPSPQRGQRVVGRGIGGLRPPFFYAKNADAEHRLWVEAFFGPSGNF
jgi:hypothetical protein